jgi:hypothetical protein
LSLDVDVTHRRRPDTCALLGRATYQMFEPGWSEWTVEDEVGICT